MHKPKPRIYFIDLNGPAARTNLKILGLAYPAWGIALPAGIATIGKYPFFVEFFNTQSEPFLILGYLTLAGLTAAIFTNRLILTRKSVRFGHSPLSRHNTADLKSLKLERSPLQKKETLLEFRFKSDDQSSQHTIETLDMEERMKARLMTALDNTAPDCQIPTAVRALLTKKTRSQVNNNSGDTIVFRYQSRLLLQKLKDMAILYQPLFWRAWTVFFALATFYMAPSIILKNFDAIDSEPGTTILFIWSNFFKLLIPLAEQTSNASTFVYDISSQYWVAVVLCFTAYLFVLCMFSYLIKPNRLQLNWLGLKESRHYFGVDLVSQSIAWVDLMSVSLNKDGKTDPQNWRLILHSAANQNDFVVLLGALGDNAKKLEFMRAIEKYAQNVAIDPDIQALFVPESDNSFTSLWLSSLSGAPQREKLTPLQPGHSLRNGEYVIEKRLGAGGQGVAYLARSTKSQPQEESDQMVEAALVIKETILPVYADSGVRRQALENFERDAQLLLKLDSDNLAKLLDYFVEDHRAYLVLERAKGQNLRKFVEEKGALPPLVVRELAKQMCDMLTYLHCQDPPVIHRDFTPENLIVNEDGHLKLIDFGVAHQLKSRTTATVVGKHAYLPPEQLRGKPTSQSDLYAMAATIYFLLTAEDPEPLTRLNPFEHSLNSTMSEAEQKALAGLCKAVEHATELDIANRTESASKFADELEQGQNFIIKVKEKVKQSVEMSNG